MMKIIFVSMFSGCVNRGAETWNALMAEGMARRGHSVTLIQGGPVPSTAHTYRVISAHFPAVDRSGDEAPSVIGRKIHGALSRVYLDRIYREEALFATKAARLVAGLRPDLVITAGGIWPFALYSLQRLVVSQRDLRIIAVDHSGMQNQFRDYVRLGVDGIVVYRPYYMEEGLHGRAGKTLVRLIPSPLDRKLFTPSGPNLALPLAAPVILTTSALVPYKGVDRVIRAVEALGYGSLLVVGDGPLRSSIEELGSRLLGPNRFARLDALPHSLMGQVYRSADVYCLASGSREYFGIAVVEAMACGCRLVLHDDPVRRWTAGDSAVYADTSDVTALTRSLQLAITSRPSVLSEDIDRFDADQCAEMFESFLGEILARPRRRLRGSAANAGATTGG